MSQHYFNPIKFNAELYSDVLSFVVEFKWMRHIKTNYGPIFHCITWQKPRPYRGSFVKFSFYSENTPHTTQYMIALALLWGLHNFTILLLLHVQIQYTYQDQLQIHTNCTKRLQIYTAHTKKLQIYTTHTERLQIYTTSSRHPLFRGYFLENSVQLLSSTSL